MTFNVSVIMSVYNGEKYLTEAVDSILNQTYQDFEFIVINDGSTDRSMDIIRSYNDTRMLIVNNKKNIGLTKSLNKGLRLAKGKYIARMDADDISMPDRLAMQVAFMENNTDVGACGTWVELLGRNKRELWKYPIDNDSIVSRLLFDSPLAHPSVIMRKYLFISNNLFYDEDYPLAQDWKLWNQCRNYFKLANIPKVLLYYRVHSESLGTINHKFRKEIISKIDRQNLLSLGIKASKKEITVHRNIASLHLKNDLNFINEANDWLLKLHRINTEKNVFPEPAFTIFLANKWYDICRKIQIKGINSFDIYNQSKLKEYLKIGIYKRLKFKFIQKFNEGSWR